MVRYIHLLRLLLLSAAGMMFTAGALYSQPLAGPNFIVRHVPSISTSAAIDSMEAMFTNLSIVSNPALNEVGFLGTPAQADDIAGRWWALDVFPVDSVEVDNADVRTVIGVDPFDPLSMGHVPGLPALTGNGVRIVMVDSGLPSPAILPSGRLLRAWTVFAPNNVGLTISPPSSGHATGVASILAGNGVGSGGYGRGIATGATIYASNLDGVFWWNIERTAAIAGAVISQNSISLKPSPLNMNEYFGAYHPVCHDLDLLVNWLGIVVTCSVGNRREHQGAPSDGYRTVSPFGTSRNTIQVGAVDYDGTPAPFSGAGPTARGRLGPGIVAPGVCITTATPETPGSTGIIYRQSSGVSNAVPAVSAATALLMEQYATCLSCRDANFPAKMPPELVKALLYNCATDVAAPFVDYRTGYGMVNVAASVHALTERFYVIGSVGHGEEKEYPLHVMGGCRVKVMMCFNDPEGPASFSPPLMNSNTPVDERDPRLNHDLDLELVPPAPSTSIVLPMTLDHTDPEHPAWPHRDTLNNTEQVVLENPTNGTWTVRVRGTRVASGLKQRFALTWCGAEMQASGLMMHDAVSPLDMGDEPNMSGGFLAASEDIWVRRERDVFGQHRYEHQNPANGSLNYVYVNVTNTGCVPAGGILHLYYASSATNLQWPYDLVAGDCGGAPSGREITVDPVTITPIQPGESQVVEIPWEVPDSALFQACGRSRNGFALVARIENSAMPPHGLREGENLYTNVRDNRRIIMKNVDLVEEKTRPNLDGVTTVRNPGRDEKLFSLCFTVPQEFDVDPFAYGTFTVDLGPTLFEAWKEGGKQGRGFVQDSDTRITIQRSDASIDAIRLSPGAEENIILRFNVQRRPARHEPQRLAMDVRQYASPSSEPPEYTGGARFIYVLDSSRVPAPGRRRWEVIGSGATDNTGSNLGLKGTVGQPVIGRISGEQVVWQGFWLPSHSGVFPIAAVLPELPTTGNAIAITGGPNPFTDHLTLSLNLPRAGHIRVRLYDGLGREIRALLDGYREAGRCTLHLDGTSLPPGAYRVMVFTDDHHSSAAFIHVK